MGLTQAVALTKRWSPVQGEVRPGFHLKRLVLVFHVRLQDAGPKLLGVGQALGREMRHQNIDGAIEQFDVVAQARSACLFQAGEPIGGGHAKSINGPKPIYQRRLFLTSGQGPQNQ